MNKEIINEMYKQVVSGLHHSLYTGSHSRSKYHNYKRMNFSYTDEKTLQVSSNSGNKGVIIELLADDTYAVQRYKINRKLDVIREERVEGVYDEQMVEYVLDSF